MKIRTALAAAALSALLLAPITAAHADDEIAPPTDSTAETTEPVDEPVLDDTAAVETYTQHETGHDPVTFCHKPGTPAAHELTTDDDGFLQGHLGHGDTLGACPPADEPTDEPTDNPTDEPTDEPTDTPTDEPTDTPTDEPTDNPTDEPTLIEPSCTTVTGSVVLTGDGAIDVPGGWESVSIAVPYTGTLAGIGTALSIDATPVQYVGLHIDTALGTLVFEEEPSYGGNLWSQTAWAGVDAGMGYPAFGSIEQYIELNGDVPVTGVRLLYTHPEPSSTTVSSFVIGCTAFTFAPAPTEEPTDEPTVTPTPTDTPTAVTPVDVPAVTPPAAAPVAAVGTVAAPTGSLASTGSDGTAALIGIAVGLLALGTTGALIARRRTATS